MSFDMARDTEHEGDCAGTLCSHCGHCVHTDRDISCRCNVGGCGCDAYSPPDGLGSEPDTLTPQRVTSSVGVEAAQTRTCERCGVNPDLLARTHGCTDRTCPSGGRVTAMDLLGIAPGYPTSERQDATEVEAYAQTVWDMLAVLGFDTDGDPTPAALIAGGGTHASFREMALHEAQEFRNDQNDADDEYDEACKTNAQLTAELADLRAKVDAVRTIALGHFTADYLDTIPDRVISSEGQLRRNILAALGGAGQDNTSEENAT